MFEFIMKYPGNWFKKKQRPALEGYTDEYLAYFRHLFARAGDVSGFQYLYTILRVQGITNGHWDAFVEAEDAVMDFSRILRQVGGRDQKRSLRMALLIYAHSTEISAFYEIIANLLRVCADQPYKMLPFEHLVRVIPGGSTSIFDKRILPSPIKKIEHIKELAAVCAEERIGEIFDGFFRNDIRNAFYHSDYAISEDGFRIIEGDRLGNNAISLNELSDILTRCFAFYSAFFIAYNEVKKGLVRGSRFLRMPNYEVLELLSDNDELTGFKIHFPNGRDSMFERKKYEGTTGLNLSVEDEGISLFVGDLDGYNRGTDWLVNGQPFRQYGTRYNRTGRWYPIIFRRDSQSLQTRAEHATTDRDVQGCLFYIYATGHQAIEFVIKSNKRLFRGSGFSMPWWSRKKRIEINECESEEGGSYLYDGTFYLEDDSPESIRRALDEISLVIGRSQAKYNAQLKFRLKYKLYADADDMHPKQNSDGTFSITISFDDPRSTLVASDLRRFPTTDWKIKAEWV